MVLGHDRKADWYHDGLWRDSPDNRPGTTPGTYFTPYHREHRQCRREGMRVIPEGLGEFYGTSYFLHIACRRKLLAHSPLASGDSVLADGVA